MMMMMIMMMFNCILYTVICKSKKMVAFSSKHLVNLVLAQHYL